MGNMSVEELKREILLCDYCMDRIQFNMLGELLANYGNRTIGHSQDIIYFNEYENRKKQLMSELNKRKEAKSSAKL